VTTRGRFKTEICRLHNRSPAPFLPLPFSPVSIRPPPLLSSSIAYRVLFVFFSFELIFLFPVGSMILGEGGITFPRCNSLQYYHASRSLVSHRPFSPFFFSESEMCLPFGQTFFPAAFPLKCGVGGIMSFLKEFSLFFLFFSFLYRKQSLSFSLLVQKLPRRAVHSERVALPEI